MESEHQKNEGLARELLAQSHLLELARGEARGPWQMLWRTRIRPALVTGGFIVLTIGLMETAGHATWLVVGGMFCLAAGLEFRPQTDRRLDALVNALERNGTLRVRPVGERE